MPATVEVRAPVSSGVSLGGTRVTRRSVQVTLHDVSAGGACFLASAADASLFEKGVSVTIKLTILARTLSVPGSVIWSRSSDGSDVKTGVRLLAELTDSLTRTSFTQWLARKSGA